jgi:tetratricopeptide (TPR) repeat protein/class 3 adenylate cyclase
MKNLIPRFIFENFKKGQFSGEFSACAIFMDISGFTPMTQSLMHHGKVGAEVLNEIINRIYEPAIESIYQHGGFITVFAGDAFTAVFPECDDPLPVLTASVEIQKTFEEKGLQQTVYGDFHLSCKIGLSYGQVRWAIVGNEHIKRYYFRGTAIDGCAVSEKFASSQQIVFDDALNQLIPAQSVEIESLGEGHYRLLKLYHYSEYRFLGEETFQEEIFPHFVPYEVKGLHRGEFRSIVSLFISFIEPESTEVLHAFIESVTDLSRDYGGFVENFDFGDKGGNVLILFGIPVSFENDLTRAIDFISALRKRYGTKIRAGITRDIAYTGLKGSLKRRCMYGALGSVINLSARFMMKAAWGEVWLSENVAAAVSHYPCNFLHALTFKGISEPVKVYTLGEKRIYSQRAYQNRLVGREHELKSLSDAISSIENGSFAGVFYLYGEAGIGKSRLTDELEKNLRGKITVAYLPADGILRQSFNPFISYLSRYFRLNELNPDESREAHFQKRFDEMLSDLENIQDERIPELVRELRRTRSVIGALSGLHFEGSLWESLDPKGRYENTLYAVKTFLKAQSLAQPLLILLEDLHWLDGDSAQLFEVLTRNIAEFPLMILASSRPNDDGSLPTLNLSADIPKNSLLLQNLPAAALPAFIENQLGRAADEPLVQFIANKSGGNPFYIEQFCLYLLENNFLEQRFGNYHLLQKEIELPGGINAILIARVDRLTQELKNMVQIASVLGNEIDLPILFELAQTLEAISGKPAFERLINRAEREQIWSGISELKEIFRHALLRDAVYEMQLTERLKKLHALTATLLEKQFAQVPERFSEMAYHYHRGEIITKARDYYAKAGAYLQGKFQNEAALEHFAKALENQAEAEQEWDILKAMGTIYELIGKSDKAEVTFLQCQILAEKLNDKRRLATAKRDLGWHYKEWGRLPEAQPYLQEALQISKEIDDQPGYSAALSHLGSLYQALGDASKALEYHEAQKTLSLQLGNRKDYSTAMGNMGIVYKNLGKYAEAEHCYETQKEICAEIGFTEGWCNANSNLAELMFYRGDYSASVAACEAINKVYLEQGDRRRWGQVQGNLGIIWKAQSKYAQALEHMQQQFYIVKESGDLDGYAISAGNIGNVYEDIGNFSKAMEYYQIKLDISRKQGMKISLRNVLTNLGGLYTYQGNYDQALSCYLEAKNLAEELGDRRGLAIVLGSIGVAYGEIERYDDALDFLNQSETLTRELQNRQFLAYCLHQKAKLLKVMGRYDEAVIINAEALETAESAGYYEMILNSKILRHRLAYQSESLLQILDAADLEKEWSAKIYEALFEIDAKKEYGEKAIRLFGELIAESPNSIYQKKIETLKKALKE